MGKGLANALLLTSKEVFKGAAPVSKVTTPGFLQFLLDNNKPDILSNGVDDGSGYIRDVKIRYRQRGVPGKSITEDNCTVQVRPAYLSYDVPSTSFRALGIAFEDDEIAKFERDALAPTRVGMTTLMKDIYEAIIEQAHGLLMDIDKDLLTLQAANFGVNQTTGNANAKTINFDKDADQNDLTTGMTGLMADAMANEFRIDNSAIVGSGLINNYYLQHLANAKGLNAAGLNTANLALPKFYYDPYAATHFGTNQFGLFEKDAVQFINVARFRGLKAGVRGNSTFFTLRLPITDSLGQGSLAGFEFDVQITYRDCPGELQIGTYDSYSNPPVQLGRGWNVILMSSYQIVHIPSNSYASGDRLYQNNGTLRYTATNS